MMRIRSFWLIALVGLGAVALIGALRPGSDVPVAYACSGGPATFEEYADAAQYVAVVEAVAAGGSENASPRLTPAPTPDNLPPFSPTPSNFDLSGIGATLQVVDDLMGGAPAQFEIDGDRRVAAEEQLRRQEASPWTVQPCPVGFLTPRYAIGERYLVVAGRYDASGRTATLLLFSLEGNSLVIGDTPDGISNILRVTAPTYDAYFEGVPYRSFGHGQNGVEYRDLTGPATVSQMQAAVAGVYLEQPPAPATVTPTPDTRPISPPSVGSAGLR